MFFSIFTKDERSALVSSMMKERALDYDKAYDMLCAWFELLTIRGAKA